MLFEKIRIFQTSNGCYSVCLKQNNVIIDFLKLNFSIFRKPEALLSSFENTVVDICGCGKIFLKIFIPLEKRSQTKY